MGEVLCGVLTALLTLALFAAAGTADYYAEVAYQRAWAEVHDAAQAD